MFERFDARIDAAAALPDARAAARAMLDVAEDVLVQWVKARGEVPTTDTREGFRLLALHRQGSQDLPSFNACRETCREIAYHYNLLNLEPLDDARPQRQRMMAMLVRHVVLFVGGKMEVEGLGEFCCASRPLRLES
ncbi:MAG TPA: hypothetical protein VKT00_13385 [Casimicrobiaceae bacterium]|nr:hypothetical protein [Casimicrobiaceae bacterium]